MHRPAPQIPARDGFALVTTLLIILVLSVIAVGAAWLASTEKRVSFAEGVHVRATFAADAGGEAAINFLRLADEPPQIVDFVDNRVHSEATTAVHGSQSFTYDAFYMQQRHRPGWGTNFRDFDYNVTTLGAASTHGQSGVDLVASRLFKVGY